MSRITRAMTKRIAAYSDDSTFAGWFDGRVYLAGRARAAEGPAAWGTAVPYILAAGVGWKLNKGWFVRWTDNAGKAHGAAIIAGGWTSSGQRVEFTLSTTVAGGDSLPEPPADDGTNDLDRDTGGGSIPPEMQVVLEMRTEPGYPGSPKTYDGPNAPTAATWGNYSVFNSWYDGNCNYHADDWRDDNPTPTWVGGGCP